jgi:hypothetical protein
MDVMNNVYEVAVETWKLAKHNCETNENFMAVAFVFFTDENEALQMGVCPLPDMSNKDFVAHVVRNICKVTNAVAVFFVAESWMLTGAAGEDEIRKVMSGEMSVSESKHRSEILYGSLETKDGVQTFTGKIDRSSWCKRITFEQIGELQHVEGRFTSFLKDPVPPTRH